MKTNILLLAAFALCITSCDKKEKDVEEEINYAILSGTLQNLGDEKAQLYDNLDISGTLDIASDGTFTDTIQLSQDGYFKLRAGYMDISFFLSKGDHMTFSADVASPDTPAIFSGKSAAIQEYIATKEKEQQELTGDFELFFGQEPETFTSAITAFAESQYKRLEVSTLPESFKKIEKRAIELGQMDLKSNYSGYQKYLADGEDVVPEEYLADFIALDKDNEEEAKQYKVYRDLVMSNIMNTIEEKKDSVTPYLEQIVDQLETLKSPTIKDYGVGDMLFLFSPSGDVQTMKDRLLALSSKEKTKESIITRYDKIKNLIKGQPSPTFSYENFKGGETALNDLKGTYVYIDVWATWCGPCIGEIPYLKELEHKYEGENIEFVSISVDTKDDYQKWRKMVTKKELGGTQLMANNAFSSTFIDEYAINAIPRFIIIDPEGNIVNADATRPSNFAIESKLDALLK
jgi:thiol-disulfide isomerase/thioredoxin